MTKVVALQLKKPHFGCCMLNVSGPAISSIAQSGDCPLKGTSVCSEQWAVGSESGFIIGWLPAMSCSFLWLDMLTALGKNFNKFDFFQKSIFFRFEILAECLHRLKYNIGGTNRDKHQICQFHFSGAIQKIIKTTEHFLGICVPFTVHCHGTAF